MANNTMTLVSSVSLACLLVASHVFVQAAPASEDELHYSGDNGDNKNINDYTNTITDNNRPSMNNNQRQRPSGLFGGLFGGLDNNRSPLPSGSINQNQFGLSEPFFQGPSGFGADLNPQSLFERLQLPGLPLIDDIFRTFTETTQNIDRRIRDGIEKLSKRPGETQRFFEVNGVAYVETCSIRRVTPGNGNNYNYGQQQQQQQQQQQMQPNQQPIQPGQMQPADDEQVSPDSDKSTQDQIVGPADVSDDSSSPLNTPRGSSPSGTDSSSPASQSQTQPGADTQSSDDKSNNSSKPTN